jgi:Na+-transporting NADH:ubiquinone oxidoreductase subunit NqrC
MNHFNKITLILIFLLLASNIVWGLQYSLKKTQLATAQHELSTMTQNKKILAFQKMFVEKILKADGTVDFNTRVELQNAVTDIHDEKITEAWNAFLSAKTEEGGQVAVKELLSLFADKAYSK